MRYLHHPHRRLTAATALFCLLTAAGAAAAQQPGALAPAAARVIRVGAVGEAQGTPDEARLSFAVETSASTARAAGQENARIMERVIQALVAAGVPRGEIETQNYTVYPEYVHEPPAEQPRVRGYRASNQVVVRTRALPRVGELIDVALGAGANRVDGLSFQLRDAGAVQAEALRRAVERARASAQTMAQALGVRLGEVLDATTGVEPVTPIPVAWGRAEAMEARDLAAPTPIEPGEQTVRAHVTLVFSIAGP